MRICTFVFLLGIMCLCTTNAQQVLGVSVLTITPTSVDTYSDTELDNYASLYYYAIADGFLWQGNSVIRSGSALGCPKADGYMSAPMLPNNSYMIQTNHWIRAYFYEVVDSTIIYEDPFGFSLISTGNAGGSDTYDPPNVYTTTYSEDYYLGSTYVGSTTNAPWIGGIRVLGSTMRGGSGYVEIYGSDLTNYWGPTSISISGGISVQTTYLSPGQVNIAYSIPLSTAAGSQSLTVTTMFGVSNPADFPVSDPPPVISGIKVNGVNSDVIPAGTSGFINIDGQFLNGATSVALSGTGVTITGFLYYSNDPNGTGRITATFQAAANATSSQTISVQTFHGNSNPTNVTVATPAMNLALVSTTISVDGRYSEDSTIQVTAVRADTGNSMPSFVGTVNIAEDGTQIYTMNGGVLPASVDLPAGGTATFVAKSLAGPQDSSTPPDSAYLKTTNYPVHGGTSLEIPQWIISGSRLDRNPSVM
jgi:hypothetical protein